VVSRSSTGLAVALVVLAVIAGKWAWAWHQDAAAREFWSPIIEAKGPVLIAPGSVVIVSNSETGMAVAQSGSTSSYVSFESSLAIGRIAALLSSRGADFKVIPAASLQFNEFRESAVVLIGAYNNPWTERLLLPLRFHFVPDQNKQGIMDTQHPGKIWARNPSLPSTDKPDYALVARFRDPSTDSVIVVASGLKQYGNDAASQFLVSPAFLRLLNKEAGPNWKNKNIEVVLRTDVVKGSAGVPIIEATHVW
jgi:hypothetical protein